MKTDERGVTAVIVAICATVLFGVGALVIDEGAARQERRELQNGADAGALALAQDCAKGACTNLDAKAVSYAGFNAVDGASRATANTISGNGVQVIARTQDAGANTDGNDHTVDFYLAPVLGGPRGAEVSATATARWGAPSGGTTLPLTFSLCEWNALVGAGGVFSTTPKVIIFHDPAQSNANQTAGTCPVAPAGMDTDGNGKVPGGFGWLELISGTCSTTVNALGWVSHNTGNGVPNTCSPSDWQNKDIFISVFDDIISKKDKLPDGSSAWANQCSNDPCYHIYGVAEMHITGYRFPGGNNTWNAPCSPPKICIAGYFIKFTIGWDGGSTGGVDLGTNEVFLTQ